MKKYLLSAVLVLSSVTSFAKVELSREEKLLKLLFDKAPKMSVEGDVRKETTLVELLEPLKMHIAAKMSLDEDVREDSPLKSFELKCETMMVDFIDCDLILQRKPLGETAISFVAQTNEDGMPIKVLNKIVRIQSGD